MLIIYYNPLIKLLLMNLQIGKLICCFLSLTTLTSKIAGLLSDLVFYYLFRESSLTIKINVSNVIRCQSSLLYIFLRKQFQCSQFLLFQCINFYGIKWVKKNMLTSLSNYVQNSRHFGSLRLKYSYSYHYHQNNKSPLVKKIRQIILFKVTPAFYILISVDYLFVDHTRFKPMC